MQSTWVSASETSGTPAEKRDLRSILWMGKLSPAVGTGAGLFRVGLAAGELPPVRTGVWLQPGAVLVLFGLCS